MKGSVSDQSLLLCSSPRAPRWWFPAMVGGGARASECATFVAQGGFSITLFAEGQRVPMFRLQPPQFRKIV